MTDKLADLTPDPKNANKGTPRGRYMIQESLQQHGAGRSILVDRDGNIIAGNKTHGVAGEIGIDDVIVVESDGTKLVAVKRTDLSIDDPEARALAIFDNRASEVGLEWDFEMLAELAGEGVPVEEMFSEKELDALGVDMGGEPVEDPGADIDKAEELREKWQTELGQLWVIGEHRLYCGDARQAKIVCDFAIYDPPFDWMHERQDAMLSWCSWKNALVMGTSSCLPLSLRDDYVSFWVWDQLTGAGISNAANTLPHRSLIMQLWFGDRKRFWSESALKVLQRYDIAGTYKSDVPQYVPIVRKYTDGKDIGHGGTKPMGLCEYIVALYSRRGEKVGDPFAGSGSFLIAAENLKRKYHGSEIDPGYVAVILDRYEKAFGVTATLVE